MTHSISHEIGQFFVEVWLAIWGVVGVAVAFVFWPVSFGKEIVMKETDIMPSTMHKCVIFALCLLGAVAAVAIVWLFVAGHMVLAAVGAVIYVVLFTATNEQLADLSGVTG